MCRHNVNSFVCNAPFGPTPKRKRFVVMQEKLTEAVVCHNSHFNVIRYATLHSVRCRTYSKFARDNRCSPRLRVYVPSMLRKQPMMAFEVCGAVLFFSIDGFVKLFPDRPARTFRFRVVCLNIRHDNCQHLCSISKLRWAFTAALSRTAQHDIRVAEVHLDTTYRLTMAVVLGKSKYLREPLTGFRHVAVYKMRKHDRTRHRAVIHGGSRPTRVRLWWFFL